MVDETEVEAAIMGFVHKGHLAAIHSKGEDVKFINASQIIIKCPSCKKVINFEKGAFAPSPKDKGFLNE